MTVVNISCRSAWLCFSILTLLISTRESLGKDGYGKGFHNQSRCLYAYMEGGSFEMNTAYGDIISEPLDPNSLTYDSDKTKCIDGPKHGKLVFTFKLDEKTKIKSVTIAMKIEPVIPKGYWQVSRANLTIARADVNKKRTFPLQVVDIYAGFDFSYSCNELVLRTLHEKKLDNETGRLEPWAEIVLDRFQLQPHPEAARYVFLPSYDCSTWFSTAGLMGLVLIVFMISVAIVGSYQLLKIDTNSFMYNKEGQLFTQSQMESNKNK